MTPELSPSSAEVAALESLIAQRFNHYLRRLLEHTAPNTLQGDEITLGDATGSMTVTDPTLLAFLRAREEWKQRPARLPTSGKTRRGKNRRASINISLGQFLKAARESGTWTVGSPLPPDLVARIVARNDLCLPDGSVPPAIKRKLEQGEKLTKEDITLLELFQ